MHVAMVAMLDVLQLQLLMLMMLLPPPPSAAVIAIVTQSAGAAIHGALAGQQLKQFSLLGQYQ